jgi:hypothetical protein
MDGITAGAGTMDGITIGVGTTDGIMDMLGVTVMVSIMDFMELETVVASNQDR